MSENATPELDIGVFGAARGTALLVDVREPHGFVSGYFSGAVLKPTGPLVDRVGEIDMTSAVAAVCASGYRSRAMADFPLASGIDAVSVAGGTGAWEPSGRPLMEGPV